MSTKSDLQAAVVRAAMARYRHARKYYSPTELDASSARNAWKACAALYAFERKTKKK